MMTWARRGSRVWLLLVLGATLLQAWPVAADTAAEKFCTQNPAVSQIDTGSPYWGTNGVRAAASRYATDAKLMNRVSFSRRVNEFDLNDPMAEFSFDLYLGAHNPGENKFSSRKAFRFLVEYYFDNTLVKAFNALWAEEGVSTWLNSYRDFHIRTRYEESYKVDLVHIEIAQERIDFENQPFWVVLRQECHWINSPPTITPTPQFTNTPYRVPTNTPYPTSTPRPTSTRTPTPWPTWTPSLTRTLTPSQTLTATDTLTPTDTATAGGPTETATQTPSLTWTPGGPTETPPGYVTPTPRPPTETEAVSTATAFAEDWATPEPPDDTCTDPYNPCEIYDPPTFPKLQLDSPTPLAVVELSTDIPSITPYVLSRTGTPVYIEIGVDERIGSAGTEIARIQGTLNAVATASMKDASGSPIDAVRVVFQAGASTADFWAIVRGVFQGDMGHATGILLFIIALIALNLILRFVLFFVPVVLRLLQILASGSTAVLILLGIVVIAIGFMLLFGLMDAESDAGPTRTPLPSGTWMTVTPVTSVPTSTYPYGLRSTPTPLPLVPNLTLRAQFQVEDSAGNVADMIINSYRAINSFGVADISGFFGLALVCIALVVSIFRSLNKTPRN